MFVDYSLSKASSVIFIIMLTFEEIKVQFAQLVLGVVFFCYCSGVIENRCYHVELFRFQVLVSCKNMRVGALAIRAVHVQ